MNTQNSPKFRELDGNDIHAILARNHVGRLVFSDGDDVDVRPLHYVFADDSIYGRTAPGSKLPNADAAPARVAFEVDEVESAFHWKSVIVRGGYRALSPTNGDEAEWRKAMALMRRVVKDAFTPADPVPERSMVFRLAIEEATGRASD